MIINNGIDFTFEFDWVGNDTFCEGFKMFGNISTDTSIPNVTNF